MCLFDRGLSKFLSLDNLFQDKLIEFFQLQMSAHHPHGSKAEEEGAFAVDWELWKVWPYELYIPVIPCPICIIYIGLI